MKVSQNGWFVIEHPFKMGDLGVPPFQETPLSILRWQFLGQTPFSDTPIFLIGGSAS
jgi:hypothetical protein